MSKAKLSILAICLLIASLFSFASAARPGRDYNQYKLTTTTKNSAPPLPSPSWDNLKIYLTYTYASYCSDGTLGNWTCFWCKHENMTDVAPLKVTEIIAPDGIEGMYGFVGYSNTEIVVAFRGTSSLENIFKDAEFFQTSYPGVPGATVHYGFLTAYSGCAPIVRNAVKQIRNSFPNLPIVTTGHSLGAAMSALAAIDLVEQGYPGIKAYSFGQSRIGNRIWTEYFLKNVASSWRVVNKYDLIPHIPPVELDYHHLSTELWFQNDTSHYKTCDGSGEDPTCANSVPFWDWNMVWHNLYLGFDVMSGHPHGCGNV